MVNLHNEEQVSGRLKFCRQMRKRSRSNGNFCFLRGSGHTKVKQELMVRSWIYGGAGGGSLELLSN